MKKYILLTICLATGIMVNAQNIEDLSSAFKQSYEAEVDSNYLVAIEKLENVYWSDLYEMNLRLGWLYYRYGDFPRSAEYYKKSMRLLPYSFEAKLGYVLPLSAMGHWNEVVNIYKKILQADPQNTLVNYRIGAIYYERKDYQKAYEHLEKVVNLYPFDYASVILLAWTNYRLGKLREARVLFEKALLISPGDKSALEGLGLIQ